MPFTTQMAVKNCFIRGSVVRYVQLPAEHVDTQLLEDATRRGMCGCLYIHVLDANVTVRYRGGQWQTVKPFGLLLCTLRQKTVMRSGRACIFGRAHNCFRIGQHLCILRRVSLHHIDHATFDAYRSRARIGAAKSQGMVSWIFEYKIVLRRLPPDLHRAISTRSNHLTVFRRMMLNPSYHFVVDLWWWTGL